MAERQIMVVAGEASGDQHAAGVVAELAKADPSLRFFGMGGPLLARAGLERIHDAAEISVMGLVEVLPKVPRILRVMRDLEDAARERRPACALLVDIPDFNLRLARRLKRLGIRVVYYVSPTLWAWRQGRVRQVAERVDRMLCILPFEEAFYRRHGVDGRYVGSPVLEQVPAPAPAQAFRRALGLPDRPTLALLPGSRHGELSRILTTQVQAAAQLRSRHPDLQVVVPVAPGLSEAEVRARFEGSGVDPRLIAGRAPEVVGASDVAVVASGTATLEAGLMERPLVVVYRMAPLTFAIGKRLVKVPYVSLVNLLLERRVVPELLQAEMTPAAIAAEVEKVLLPGEAREQMIAGLRGLRAVLGPPGASARAAQAVLEVLRAG